MLTRPGMIITLASVSSPCLLVHITPLVMVMVVVVVVPGIIIPRDLLLSINRRDWSMGRIIRSIMGMDMDIPLDRDLDRVGRVDSIRLMDMDRVGMDMDMGIDLLAC